VAALLTDPRLASVEFQGLAALSLLKKRRQAATGNGRTIVTEPSLWEFVTQRPWLIDRHAFDWEQHRYLVPLYQAYSLAPDGTVGLELVIMKGAQIGASIFAMLALLYTALRFPGCWLGFFLPDQAMTHIFSAQRFKPLVESNAAVAPLLGGEAGTGDNSARLRNLGTSSISFSYMGGKTSTESAPMLGIFLDELRRMSPTEVALVQQRISHSPYPIQVQLSTAGYPQNDIDAAFSRTTQHYWHTNCGCPDGVVLSDIWPECIGMDGADLFYRCPTCSTRIANPQHGRYIAHAPSNAPRQGFHIPQTISLAPLHTPTALFRQYSNPNYDRGEFVRSALGRPYIDPESTLVTLDDLAACENPDLAWATEGTNSYMGVDCMGGWNDVVILGRTERHKLRLLHVERLDGDDPFDDGRLDALMRRYDVSCACVDLNPSWNEAMRFAKRWPMRCWLVTYSNSPAGDMYMWRDRVRRKHQIPNEPDARFKFIVTIQRYKAIDYALGLFRERLIELPHRRGLTQTIYDDHGIKRPVFMGEELFWPHMTRIVRKKVVDDDTGEMKMDMIKIGADPHFGFAFTYSVAAASRTAGGRLAMI
jgi:hypothetical protein